MMSYFFLDILLQAVDIDTDMDRYVEQRCVTTVDSTPKSTSVLAIHQGWRKYDGATARDYSICVVQKDLSRPALISVPLGRATKTCSLKQETMALVMKL